MSSHWRKPIEERRTALGMVKTYLFGMLLALVFVLPWAFIVEKHHIQLDLASIVGVALGALGMITAFFIREKP